MFRTVSTALICVSIFGIAQPSQAAETSSLRGCWSSFWSRVHAIEANWKDSCRECTQNWYRNHAQPEYGLRALAGRHASRHAGMVVFIHGYNSRPEDLETFVRETQQAGYRCASFRYPNDQSLVKSARLLSDVLSDQKGDISIIAHSMGGLIAREAIENPQLDHGNVRRLIMITPPNNGSALARFAYSMDIVEYLTCDRRRKESGFVYGSIIDGLAEATDDMSPNSKFLRQLNSRPRNAKVRYTIVLGTDGPWDPTNLRKTRNCVSHLSGRCAWVRTAKEAIKSGLPELDELVAGKGDGIVSVKRGRLDGVEDVIIGEFDHTDFFSDDPNPSAVKARDRIIARLGE